MQIILNFPYTEKYVNIKYILLKYVTFIYNIILISQIFRKVN